MKKYYLLLMFALFQHICFGQPTFSIDDINAAPGTEICLDVTVNDYTDIVATSFSINWDAQVLSLTDVKNFGLPGLNQTFFELSQVATGKLGLSGWMTSVDTPVTLTDGSSIFQICFTTLAPCTTSNIVFTDDPTAIYTSRENLFPQNIGAFLDNGSATVGLIESYTADTTFCFGDSLQLNVHAPTATTYEWSSLNGYLEFSCTDCPNPMVTFSPNTPFGETSDRAIITVSNDNDCEETATIDLNTILYIDMFPLEPTRYFCEGETISLDNEDILSNPAATYDWTGPNNFNSTEQYLVIPNATASDAGIYQVIVTDFYGCSFSASFSILPNILISLEEVIPESCTGNEDGNITVAVQSGGGNLSFTWSNGSTNPYTVNDLVAGTYSVTVADETGCTSIRENIVVDTGLIVNITQDTIICGGEELQLMVEAPYAVSYEWFSLEPLSCTDCPNPIVQQAFLDDVYIVVITGPNGCQETAEINVGVRQYLDFGLLQFSNSPVCAGDSLFFEPNVFNAQSYQWSGPSGVFSTESHPFLTDLSMEDIGEYSLEIVDDAGCMIGASFDVNLIDGPEIFVDVIVNDCNEDCEGIIEVFAIGSNPPYTYEWSTDDTSSFISGLCAGMYEVTVSSENCSSIETFIIDNPPPLQIDMAEVTANASCLGGGGMITIYISGGTGAYTVDWGEGPMAGGTILDDLSAGVYSITVTDQNGCVVVSDPIEVSDNPIYSINEDVLICEGEAAQLQINAPFAIEISWAPTTGLDDPSSPSPLASPSVTTTYMASVTDINGCIGTESVTVFVADDGCTIITRDTILVGDSVLWCDPTMGPLGLKIEEVTCGPEGFVDFEIQNDSTCYFYQGLSTGVDSICMTICVNGTMNCYEALLIVTVEEDAVWPGDTDSDGFANHFDILNIGLGFDSTGPVRPAATLDWVAQAALEWSQNTPISNINYKHIDTNGDGQIDAQDTTAIGLNWGSEHNFMSGEDEFERNAMIPFYIKPDTLIEGAEMSLPIILGEEDAPAEDIYGLAFSLVYNPDVVVPGSTHADFSSSWLGTLGTELMVMQKDFHSQGRIDIGITRIDGTNVSGSGTIGHLHITIEDDILLLHYPNGLVNDGSALFDIQDVRLINFNEENISVNTISTESEIITATKQPDLSRLIRIFPNPANNRFFVESHQLNVAQIELLDIHGRLIKTMVPINAGLTSIPIQGLAPGVYFIKVFAKQGIAGQRVIID